VRESARERQKADAGPNEKAFNYIIKVIFVTVASCRLCFFAAAAATAFVGIVIKMLSSLRKHTSCYAEASTLSESGFCFNSAADFRARFVIAVCFNFNYFVIHDSAWFQNP
jgi:ABC-type antimicrobial peptide transport system permease subunit